MCVSLDLWTLQTRLDGQGSLQKVQSRSHLTDAAIVAGHVVEGHRLAKFVVFAEFFGLFEQVQCTVDVFFLEIVNC